MKKATTYLASLALAALFTVCISHVVQAQVVLPDIQVNSGSYEDVDIDAGSKSIAVLNDTVYTVYNASPTETSSNVYFSKSVDGGLSFANEISVSTGTTPMTTTLPVIAVDQNGTIYITWTGITGINEVWNIWFTKSSNGGATFQDPIMISTQNAFAYSSMGTFGNSVYIFYADAANYPCADYYFVRSTNNGQSFENAVQINDAPCADGIYFSNLTAMDIDASGNIYLAWVDGRRTNGNGDIFMSQSTDNGANFSSNVMVNSMSSLGVDSAQYYPDITVDAAQNVYISFVDMKLGNDWPNHRVYLTKSIDGGSTFAPEALLDGYENVCKNHNIATTEQGKLVAVMCAAGLTGWSVWLRESSDGGSSFSTPVALSNTQSTNDFSDLHISTGPNENVYAIWKDGREGPMNVYFARTDNPVSIEEAFSADEYLIYPNPTNGQFSIAFETTVTEVEIAIVDLLGKLISTYTYSNTSTVNLELNQSAGVYYVQLKTATGQQTLKLIKR